MRSSDFLRRWLCLVATAGVLFGCSNAPDPGPVFADALVAMSAASARANKAIRITDLAAFEWDRMHVFPPNSPVKLVSESLGQSLPYDLYQVRIFERDDINLIVFQNGDRIAAFVALERERLDFTLPDGAVALTAKEAVFEASGQGGSLALAAAAHGRP